MPEPYAVADVAAPDLPRRSRLYALAPIGVATPYVESLTGYITRLAEAHCLQTRVLVLRELAPQLGWPATQVSGHLAKSGHALNGSGVLADRAVRSLEALTGQQGLACLTLRAWRAVLAARALLRPVRAWCPDCYREWSARGQPVYDPLMWAIAVVHVCPVHRRPLRLRCPVCQTTAQSVLAPWSQPGHCAACGAWLGAEHAATARAVLRQGARAEAIWTATAVGELLGAVGRETAPASGAQLRAAFGRCLAAYTRGNIAALAQLLDRPRNTVWLWCQGQVVPSLDSLVQVGRCLGLTPLQFLSEDHATGQPPGMRRPRGSRGPRKRPVPFQRLEVHQSLEAVLQDATRTPSVHEVARRLGYDTGMLYRYEPELCRRIAGRYLDHLARCGQQRVQSLCATVRALVFALHAQGLAPTRHDVESVLQTPGILRDPVVRAALIAAREDCRMHEVNI